MNFEYTAPSYCQLTAAELDEEELYRTLLIFKWGFVADVKLFYEIMRSQGVENHANWCVRTF